MPSNAESIASLRRRIETGIFVRGQNIGHAGPEFTDDAVAAIDELCSLAGAVAERETDPGSNENGVWQKCPICDGHKLLQYPEGVPLGGQWSSSSTGPYPCHFCKGVGIVRLRSSSPSGESRDGEATALVRAACEWADAETPRDKRFTDEKLNNAVAKYRGLAAVSPPATASETPGMDDAERLDAIERREISIECMGTTKPYFNVIVDRNGFLATTADTSRPQTLRAAIDEALAESRSSLPVPTAPK